SSAGFTARGGEVVGLAGLPGSGVSDLLAMLFGVGKARKGEVHFPDGSGLPKNPTEAARRNIAMISGERRHNGLMLDKSIAFNISSIVAGARDWGPRWHSPKVALGRAARQIAALRIAGTPHMMVRSLSAGNQQKVVIARWLEIGPQVVLLDDPVRGLDVGAKQEIYALIRQMAASGCIVLFSSTELSELAGLSDRVLAFYEGRLAEEISGTDMDDQIVLQLITGGKTTDKTIPGKTIPGKTGTDKTPGADQPKETRQGAWHDKHRSHTTPSRIERQADGARPSHSRGDRRHRRARRHDRGHLLFQANVPRSGQSVFAA
ncbi:MAG: ATP-binding cassette domain-containing protein, partial [Mesorhizobium sp.]